MHYLVQVSSKDGKPVCPPFTIPAEEAGNCADFFIACDLVCVFSLARTFDEIRNTFFDKERNNHGGN